MASRILLNIHDRSFSKSFFNSLPHNYNEYLKISDYWRRYNKHTKGNSVAKVKTVVHQGSTLSWNINLFAELFIALFSVLISILAVL